MAEKPPRDIHDTFYVQWLLQAEHLFACAQVVHDEHLRQRAKFKEDHIASGDVMHVKPISFGRLMFGFGQYLLIGLALEVMFKALWMHKKADIVQQVPGFWKSADGHRLVMLAEDTGFHLENREKEALTELTEVVIWMGKYPVDFKSPNRPEKTETKLAWDFYVDLFGRLREILKNPRPSPNSGPTSLAEPS